MDIKKLLRIQDNSVGDILQGRVDAGTISMIKRAIAEELQAWYQYWVVVPFIHGLDRPDIEEWFVKTAKDELDDHAVKLMNRLSELGGDSSDFLYPESWKNLAGSPLLSTGGDFSIDANLIMNIIAEIHAIETYTILCDMTRGADYKTYTLSKQILDDEQEHLQDLYDFAQDRNLDLECISYPGIEYAQKLQIAEAFKKLSDSAEVVASKTWDGGDMTLYKLSKNNYKLSLIQGEGDDKKEESVRISKGNVEKKDNILSDLLYSLSGDTGVFNEDEESVKNVFTTLSQELSGE